MSQICLVADITITLQLFKAQSALQNCTNTESCNEECTRIERQAQSKMRCVNAACSVIMLIFFVGVFLRFADR